MRSLSFVSLLLTLLLFSTLFIPAASAALPTYDSQGKPLPSLAPMLQKSMPAVVNISTKAKVSKQQLHPFFNDPMFRRFFNIPEHQQQQRQSRPNSLGSGVIVDAKKGYVLTNHHVIENADEITVTLNDGRNLTAELIGTDPHTDIAVLKIPTNHLTALPFANSDSLNVGDFVVAIGNPFGLGQTATSGIVSALGRSGLGIEGYEDFIQTDASINPGNSGGALVNLNGELIGINTAIFSKSGGNIGIGFAIPVNMAQGVMDQLLQYGEVRRGLLGVQVQDLTPDLAAAFDIKETKGAVIAQVIPNTAASRAGLENGDVILSIDGRKVESSSDVRNAIGLVRPGERVDIKILRDNRYKTISATIGQSDGNVVSQNGVNQSGFSAKKLHARLEGASFAQEGDEILVSKIEIDSPAWRTGLREGDAILSINRHRVDSVNDLNKIAKQGYKRLAINIRRGDSALFLAIN